MSLFAAALLPLVLHGNLPPRAGSSTVSVPEGGFAFELPRGYSARPIRDGRGRSIPGYFEIDSSDDVPAVQVESEPWSVSRGLPAPSDSVLSYVELVATEYCDAVGPDSETRVDSIVALHRYRGRRGFEIFEASVRVVRESFAIDGGDSVATSDSVPSLHGSQSDDERFTTGPLYAVNLSSPGTRLMVWIHPYCDERRNPRAERVGRFISRTVHRLEAVSSRGR